jgi:hypothetical protein
MCNNYAINNTEDTMNITPDPQSQRDAVITYECVPVEIGHAVAEFHFAAEDGAYNPENKANDRLYLRGADLTDIMPDYFWADVLDALKQAGFID